MFLRRAAAIVLAATSVAATFGASANAAPDPTSPTGAARVIETNGRRASALAEALNGAEYRLSEAKAQLTEARSQIESLQAQIAEDRARLASEGAGIYRSASEGKLVPVEAAGRSANARREIHYRAVAADATRRLVDQLEATRAALTEQESRADTARRDAQDERDRLARARDDLAAADARQQQLLANAPPEVTRNLSDPGTSGTTAPASAGAPRPATTPPTSSAPTTPTPAPGPSAPSPTTPPTTGPPASPSAPAPSSGAAAAVAFAYAQLGKPYVYAAAGPDTYDCSGLTMAAWRAGGVSLPHYSGAQYSRLQKVSMSALLPGDLIFWGPGGSDHVAIYIGGGKIISAPYTGAVVRIQGIWGTPVGAARP